MGLAITREIIDAHNGRIWAENNKDMPGATFNFLLPIIHEKAMEGHKIISENNIQIKDSTDSNKAATILIIDDEEPCLMTMELLLHNTPYKLIKANSGGEGLKYLESNNQIDLVLLDLMLPDIYGLNVLDKIKSDPNLSNIPVILQSGTADKQEIDKAYNMGIVSYIKKPYDRQNVINEINKVI